MAVKHGHLQVVIEILLKDDFKARLNSKIKDGTDVDDDDGDYDHDEDDVHDDFLMIIIIMRMVW